MIQVNLSGRLGNQMFRYAIARKYIEENKGEDKDLYFICNNIKKRDIENQLKDFKILNYKEMDTPILTTKQKILYKYMNIYESLIEKMCKENKSIKINQFKSRIQNRINKVGIYNMDNSYIDINFNKLDNVYFNGNFESAKYFDDIRDILLKEFTPKQKKLKKNSELYDIIDKSNSVCISIRRGDFLSNKNLNTHYVCTPDYFERAIELAKKVINNPTFIVFSDDVDWVKENIKFPSDAYYETGDDPVWEKLRLMYSCKNFIISNSTFSWWAQYLSRNEEKKVIAPSRWKNGFQNNDIYDEKWILIDP